MPFIDERRPVQDLRNIAGQGEVLPDPSLLETFGAAFRTQNVVGSYLTSRGQPNPYEIEPDFDAIDYVKDDKQFAPYVEEFAGIFNRPAAEAKKQQIIKEQQDRRTLDAAGGLGLVAELAAGVVDLPTLIPIGGPVIAGARSVGTTALRVGVGAGLDAAVSETALQATQATRTAEETALNIGGSVVLGGALGALVGRYMTPAEAGALSKKIEGQEAAFGEVSEGFASMSRAASAGAAARDSGPLTLKDETIIKRIPGVNIQDPLIRLQLSELDEARGTVRGLAETPLEYAENAQGIATEVGGSVETRMKMWHAPLANTLQNIDTHYARYYHGTPEVNAIQRRLSATRSEFDRWRGRGDKLTYREFKQEVSKAAFSGEKHQIPEVAAAAAEYRKIDDMMKQRAIDAGLFPEDVAVAGDVSHLFRMYNREKIIAERGQFSRILQDYFTVRRDELARRLDAEAKAQQKPAFDPETFDWSAPMPARFRQAAVPQGGVSAASGEIPQAEKVVLFHGTDSLPFEKYDLAFAGTGAGRAGERAIFMAPTPEEAYGFAVSGGRRNAPRVETTTVDTRDFLIVDDLQYPSTSAIAAKLKQAADEGRGGVIFRNMDDRSPLQVGAGDAIRDQIAIIDTARIKRVPEASGAPKKAAKASDPKLDEFSRLTDAEVGAIVDETINTILGNAGGRIPYDAIVSGPRGPLKERLLRIESGRIQDFLELDIEQILRSQVRTMSADVELARKFGSVDLAEQLRKINDEADAKIAQAKTPKERQKLETARKAAVRDVEGIRDRLRGQYKMPENPDGIVLRAGWVIRNLNYLRLLGGMTISAIPDMAKPVFTYGLTSTLKDGFLPMVRNFRAFRLAADEVKAAGTALDMVLDSRVMALADITDDFGRHSKFERGLSAMTTRFGLVSAMAPWNAAMKQFSGMIAMNNLLRAAQRAADGTASRKEIANLAAAGINHDMASRIARQFAEHGEEKSGILLARGINWTDPLALDAFRTAVVRDVDRVIVTPGQDKPLWMSTELGKLVGQFRTFGVSSVQRTMLAGMQQRDAATFNGVLIMLALGAMTYKLKMDFAGKDTSDNPAVWAVEAFDRSGLVGWLMEANNAAEKITRGAIGLSAITGEQISRYASRNATASLLGPALGTVQDIIDVTGASLSGEMQKRDARKMFQLVPGQNLFYIRSLFHRAGEALIEDLPGK